MAAALQRCEGYCDLKMWETAWEELEELPSEFKVDLRVLSWRILILMGLGEYQKASYIGLSLSEHFPNRLSILLTTAECLIHCREFITASQLLKNALAKASDQPNLWLTLARVEALLGKPESAKDCVREYVKLDPDSKADIFSIPELAVIW